MMLSVVEFTLFLQAFSENVFIHLIMWGLCAFRLHEQKSTWDFQMLVPSGFFFFNEQFLKYIPKECIFKFLDEFTQAH